MARKVHYFSFYLSKEMEQQREAHPACFSKVEYVKKSITASDSDLILVSTALAKSGTGFLPKKEFRLSGNEKHIYLPSFGYRGKVFRKLKMIFMQLQVVLYILRNVKQNDKVLLYHSPAYIRPFMFVRMFKKIDLTLELNDLYYAIKKEMLPLKQKEDEFIQSADQYLFINSLSEKRFNKGKPYVLSFGNYELPKRRNEQNSDGKVHVVYAGIIENARKAAELAAQSVAFLDNTFVVHILGFGNDEQISIFNAVVDSVNKQKGYDAVIFHGRLRGQDYSDFLHRCHIGVSSHAYLPEEMDSANYTFPSKIPTYIAHDLMVVSPNIPCVVDSPFSEFTTFYGKHTPEELAQAIRECALSLKKDPQSPSQLIAKMDAEFKISIATII